MDRRKTERKFKKRQGTEQREEIKNRERQPQRGKQKKINR